MHAIAIDREDIKESLQVINQVTEEVKEGKKFFDFPGRNQKSAMGNQHASILREEHSKVRSMAKCPIVPVCSD